MTVPINPGKPEDGPQMFEPYHPPPQVQRTRPIGQPGGPGDTAKKAAIGTVTVIVVLVGLFCVLPILICSGMALFGAVLPGTGAPSPAP